MTTCFSKRYFPAAIVLLTFSWMLFACGSKNGFVADTPVARFTYTSTRSFPVTVQFVNTSVLTGPGPASYLWDFGDGGTVTTGAGPVSHIYTSGGTYAVKLVQIDATGTRDSVYVTINMAAAGPSGSSTRLSAASFIFSISNSSYITTFTNTSVNAGSYLWEFGDGTTSTSNSSTVTKLYPSPGTYPVVLTASSSVGTDSCSATIIFQ